MNSSPEDTGGAHAPEVDRLVVLADAALGLTALVEHVSGQAVRRLAPVTRPFLRVALHPPLVPSRWQPERVATAFRTRGAGVRVDLSGAISTLLDRLVPELLEQVLRRVDLTELVVAHVDLDRVVAHVDLDAAVAGVDIDAVVARVDLDEIAAGLDVDAVARRLDVDAVLDRLDLTELVLRRIDLDALVAAVLAHVDLAAIANDVIDAVDLPEIIRESSGAMTSETIRGARMRGVAADQAIGRVRDRLLPHRDRQRVSAGANNTPDRVPQQVSDPMTDSVASAPPPAPDRP